MESESTSFDFYCYTADDTVVKNMYNSLAGNSLNVESYSDTTIKGTVNAKENCYLYSSIPYDDGWSVYVDGKKAETFGFYIYNKSSLKLNKSKRRKDKIIVE